MMLVEMFSLKQKEIFNESGNDFLMKHLMKMETELLSTQLQANIIQRKIYLKIQYYHSGKEC
jgi:hypothetical protein